MTEKVSINRVNWACNQKDEGEKVVECVRFSFGEAQNTENYLDVAEYWIDPNSEHEISIESNHLATCLLLQMMLWNCSIEVSLLTLLKVKGPHDGSVSWDGLGDKKKDMFIFVDEWQAEKNVPDEYCHPVDSLNYFSLYVVVLLDEGLLKNLELVEDVDHRDIEVVLPDYWPIVPNFSLFVMAFFVFRIVEFLVFWDNADLLPH